MIVDDEPIVGKRLKRMLEKDGHTVQTFTRGSLALESLKTCTYDLIITDLKMGKIDGLHLLEYAARLEPEPKVIIISGLKQGKYPEEALHRGPFAYLVKPFRMEELRVIIKRAGGSKLH